MNSWLFQIFFQVLISYGAQNLRQFYSSINTDLKNYLHKLHARIPHRIIPLIWNDPVIQKIALIISSTKQLRSNINVILKNILKCYQKKLIKNDH